MKIYATPCTRVLRTHKFVGSSESVKIFSLRKAFGRDLRTCTLVKICAFRVAQVMSPSLCNTSCQMSYACLHVMGSFHLLHFFFSFFFASAEQPRTCPRLHFLKNGTCTPCSACGLGHGVLQLCTLNTDTVCQPCTAKFNFSPKISSTEQCQHCSDEICDPSKKLVSIHLKRR